MTHSLKSLGLTPTQAWPNTQPAAQPGAELMQQALAKPVPNGRPKLRQLTAQLTTADIEKAAGYIVNHQITTGIGERGENICIMLAIQLGEVLETFHQYAAAVDSVPLDYTAVQQHFDPRQWATMSSNKRLQLEAAMMRVRASIQHQIHGEIRKLEGHAKTLQGFNPKAQEALMRGQLRRRGLTTKQIEKELARLRKAGELA